VKYKVLSVHKHHTTIAMRWHWSKFPHTF